MILENLVRGPLLRRYKRFIADVELEDGVVQAHCPNSGSMKTLLDAGNVAWLSRADSPKRKLKYTMQFIELATGDMACVNTMLPNKLVYEAIEAGHVPEFAGHDALRAEVKFGKENSRVDLLVEKDGKKHFIEIKNVTLMEKQGLAQFPDAVTTRGQKHLRELSEEVRNGHAGYIFYLINRTDCSSFSIAEHIDPKYQQELEAAKQQGVRVLAYQTAIQKHEHAVEIVVGDPVCCLV